MVIFHSYVSLPEGSCGFMQYHRLETRYSGIWDIDRYWGCTVDLWEIYIQKDLNYTIKPTQDGNCIVSKLYLSPNIYCFDQHFWLPKHCDATAEITIGILVLYFHMVSGTSMTRIMDPIFFPSNLCGAAGFSFKEFQGVDIGDTWGFLGIMISHDVWFVSACFP